MEEPLTEKLLDQLLSAPTLKTYLSHNNPTDKTLSDYLTFLLDEKHLKRSWVVREAGLSPTYGYQIFEGQRNPAREKLLALAFAMSLSLRETNRLLQAGGANVLYPKHRRDVIIIFGITKGFSLFQVNEALFSFNETTIDAQ